MEIHLPEYRVHDGVVRVRLVRGPLHHKNATPAPSAIATAAAVSTPTGIANLLAPIYHCLIYEVHPQHMSIMHAV